MYMFDNRITIADRKIWRSISAAMNTKPQVSHFQPVHVERHKQIQLGYNRRLYVRYRHKPSGAGRGNNTPFMFPPLTRTGEYEKESLRETIFRAKEIFEKPDSPSA